MNKNGTTENLKPNKPGEVKQGAGRPKGSKDRRWATLEYWFTELQKTLADERLPISDKAKAQLKCLELILAKRALPAESSEESAANAADALKLLKELEDSTLPKDGK